MAFVTQVTSDCMSRGLACNETCLAFWKMLHTHTNNKVRRDTECKHTSRLVCVTMPVCFYVLVYVCILNCVCVCPVLSLQAKWGHFAGPHNFKGLFEDGRGKSWVYVRIKRLVVMVRVLVRS